MFFASTGFLLLLGLVCLVFVWTRAGQQWDGQLLPRAERGGGYLQQTTLVGPAQAMLSFLGSPVVLAILLGAVVLAGALGGRLLAGLAGVGVVLASVALAGLLKLVISRPYLGVAGSSAHNSFPSGHVAGAVGLLFAVMLVLPVRARWWCAAPGVAGISVVTSATMIVGWHRFSDAIGGLALAAMLCCLAAAVLVRRREPMPVAGARGRLEWSAGLLVLVGSLPMWLAAGAVTIPVGLFVAIALANGVTVLSVVAVLLLLEAHDFGSRREQGRLTLHNG